MATEKADDRFRVMGQYVLIVAAMRVTAALMFPALGQPLAGDQLFASTFLMAGHAALYHWGAAFRKKNSLVAYLGMQGTLVMAIGLFSLTLWLFLALFVTLVAQGVSLVRRAMR